AFAPMQDLRAIAGTIQALRGVARDGTAVAGRIGRGNGDQLAQSSDESVSQFAIGECHGSVSLEVALLYTGFWGTVWTGSFRGAAENRRDRCRHGRRNRGQLPAARRPRRVPHR